MAAKRTFDNISVMSCMEVRFNCDGERIQWNGLIMAVTKKTITYFVTIKHVIEHPPIKNPILKCLISTNKRVSFSYQMKNGWLCVDTL